VPRQEAPSTVAGGKVAQFGRLEWVEEPAMGQRTAIHAIAGDRMGLARLPPG
jgi:hypothetical protein